MIKSGEQSWSDPKTYFNVGYQIITSW